MSQVGLEEAQRRHTCGPPHGPSSANSRLVGIVTCKVLPSRARLMKGMVGPGPRAMGHGVGT